MRKNNTSETIVTANARPSKIVRSGEHPLDRLTQEQIERHNKQPINYTYK